MRKRRGIGFDGGGRLIGEPRYKYNQEAHGERVRAWKRLEFWFPGSFMGTVPMTDRTGSAGRIRGGASVAVRSQAGAWERGKRAHLV